MTEYFGYTTETANSGSVTGLWCRNKTYVTGFTCPGSGTYNIVSLGSWAKSLGGTAGHLRVAIFDTSHNLIAQGDAEILVNSTTLQWWNHTSFHNAAGEDISPTLTGGTQYDIGVTSDANDCRIGNDAGTSGDYTYGAVDYTGGWTVSPLNDSGDSSNRYCVRCGVVAAGVAYTIHAITDSEAAGYTSKRSFCRTSDGTLWCFYSRLEAGYRQIFAIKSTDGGANWTGETQLSTGSTTCYYATCAVDSNDNIHVVYTKEASGVENLHYIYYNGSSWTGEETLTTDGYSHQYCPALAIDSANKLHLTWYAWSTPGVLNYKNKTSGGAWSGTTTLRSVSGDIIYMPSIFVDKNDVIHIVFSLKVSGGSYFHLQYMKSTDGGSNWSGLTALTSDSSDNYYPCITCDCANGYPKVVWNKWTTDRHIYFIKWNGSSWDTAVDLTSGESNYQENPSIACDKDDHLYVVWFGYDGLYYQIRYRSSTDGGANWGSISYLTSASVHQRYPNLINARWRVNGTAKVNIPSEGYTFIWHNDSDYLKIYNSADLAWETPSGLLIPVAMANYRQRRN